MDFDFMTIAELAEELGSRIRDYRVRKGMEQTEVAAVAGISDRTLRALEQGEGSSLETLLRVMKALGTLDSLTAMFPMGVSIDPLAMLKQSTRPRRVVKKRGPRG